MRDTETETLWSHITGEGLHGELAGHRMPISNLLQMNASQALALDPETQVAISDRPGRARRAIWKIAFSRLRADNPDARLRRMFRNTLGTEDTRRPRMDLGLGVWSDKARKYYPVETLREHDRTIIDEFDGRTLLVYLDPLTSTPAAIYTDASEASIDGREIRLDNGQVIRSGVLAGADRISVPTDQPQQIFTRWYGFALTFPGPDVYGQ